MPDEISVILDISCAPEHWRESFVSVSNQQVRPKHVRILYSGPAIKVPPRIMQALGADPKLTNGITSDVVYSPSPLSPDVLRKVCCASNYVAILDARYKYRQDKLVKLLQIMNTYPFVAYAYNEYRDKDGVHRQTRPFAQHRPFIMQNGIIRIGVLKTLLEDTGITTLEQFQQCIPRIGLPYLVPSACDEEIC